MRRLFYVMAFLKKFHCPCVWIPLYFVGNSLLFWLEKAVENLHLISDEFGIVNADIALLSSWKRKKAFNIRYDYGNKALTL